MSDISEEGPGGEGGGHQATPEPEEKKIYTQSQWNEARMQWLSRSWGIATAPFWLILLMSLEGKFEGIEALAIAIGGLAVCFWYSILYGWRYGKATGKWFWM